jgi:hypothetical protein
VLITTNLIFVTRDKDMNAQLQLLVWQRGNLGIITLARSVIQGKDSMERVMSAQSQDVLAQYMSTSKINLAVNLMLIKKKNHIKHIDNFFSGTRYLLLELITPTVWNSCFFSKEHCS